MNALAQKPIEARRPRRCHGLVLMDALLASVMLAIVVLGMSYASTAAQQHLRFGEQRLLAARMAEHLMEEILSRPYGGSNPAERGRFHLDDYDGYVEEHPFEDFAGEPYADAEHVVSRSVAVASEVWMVGGLGAEPISGKRVTVTVESVNGQVWTLTRLIVEPMQ